MRKHFLKVISAAVGLGALAISAGPAAAWHSYRWYADYAPLYPRYYGPPVVYVVPPAYAYYPRPLYRACCGVVYGPAGTYYPRAVYYPRAAYYTYGYVYRGCCGRRW